MTSDSNRAAASRLCLDCGLCCNGVLFDRVMLQPGDQPKALAAKGLKIKKKEFFTQPCLALCGVLCTIYQDRPTRCRLFECGQYQQVSEGELAQESALARIADVKAQVVRIESLLEGLNGNNLRKSLAQRYANVIAEPPETVPQREVLVAAMEALQRDLGDYFRVT